MLYYWHGGNLMKVILLFLCILSSLRAADNISLPAGQGKAFLTDPASRVFPLVIGLTTDGASNPVPILGTGGAVTANQGAAGVAAWPVSVAALPLPAGAATDAKQDTGNSSLSSIDGKMTKADTDNVKIISNKGMASIGVLRNDYSVTPVTTAAYVELVASTSDVINSIMVFDSSGETLVIAVGAAASEVDQFIVPPGGSGQIDLYISSGSRISATALSANATTGELDLTFLK